MPAGVVYTTFHHPMLGTIVIHHNLPMTETALSRCLDDGLSPGDWLALLNRKVFFYPDEKQLRRLTEAKLNRGVPREVIVFDTLPLARAHLDRLRLCPINSGSTIRKPARRGLSTFTLAKDVTYRQWQKQRGGRDTVVEIVADEAVPDAGRFIVEVRAVGDS